MLGIDVHAEHLAQQHYSCSCCFGREATPGSRWQQLAPVPRIATYAPTGAVPLSLLAMSWPAVSPLQ